MAYPLIEIFTTVSVSPMAIGLDALLYVMRNGHTAGVPTQALYFAEKVAVVAIAPRDVATTELVALNRAIDLIAQTIRMREEIERADRGLVLPAIERTIAPSDDEGGQKVRRPVPLVPRSPIGSHADIPF